ncbi:indolepyruvate oxidoreductase subunit beta [Anaerospora hongkongensis]|uniref:indolepyruvate oxidoreductase subunit beta n=1 Tax=Anaerospora hongkongensis TaxID=244830 RepID=UPI002FD912F9
MARTKNVLLVGVGGQGTILTGKILSSGLVKAGFDVKMSEVHGMAQRGGSVSNQVRYGQKVYSPIISKGEADILIAYETMEALRWLEYLNPNGKVIVNDYQIPSAPILMGKQDYPVGVLDMLKEKANTSVVKAAEIAEELGNIKAMNIVLFGALVKGMQLMDIDWEQTIESNVNPKTVELNIKAFRAGLRAVNY